MAFNPFQSFRKYQKFWMATILLVCMITFVLCTGVGGDLSERLLNLFRGHHGKLWAKLDGRSFYSDEFDKLKTQRNMINDFMHECDKLVLDRIDKYMKEDTDPAHRKVLMARLTAIDADLKLRKTRKYFFDSGTKLDELVEFVMWKTLADKLGVELVPDTIKFMFEKEVFARVPLGERTVLPLFGGLDSRHIQFELRHKYQNINDETIIRALRDEYRVRIAQQAYLQAQTGIYRYGTFFKFKSLETETRIPLSPAQLWDMYKDKRSQYDVVLLPVRVEQFLDKIEAPPADELLAFFKKYQKVPFDPASATPGFEIPTQVKVEWVMADPESPFYKSAAQAVSVLEMTPPVAWSPFFPNLTALTSYGADPLAWNASMEQNYSSLKKGTRGERYQSAPLTEPALPSLIAYLGKPTPQLAASIAGLGAGLEIPGHIQAGYVAHLYPKHQKQIEELLVAENKPRARLMGSLAALGAHSPFTAGILSPFAALEAWNRAAHAEQFLPLAAVAAELKEMRERKLAGDWVNANMVEVKDKLDQLPAGKKEAIRRNVEPLVRKYGLIHQATTNYYHRFNIAKAPELAELKKSFENYRHLVNNPEGRQDVTDRLKEDDFYKLFFSGESFAAGKYVIKPWPPVIEIKSEQPNTPPKTISLFDTASKPFLFWKVDEKPSQAPDDLAQVKDRVLTAWKMQKAKEKFALARAKEIADKLEKGGGDMLDILRAEAKTLGVDYVYLPGVAQFYPEERGVRFYRDYPLPKDTFAFPREDLLKQILALTNMDKSISIDYKALDDPNKKLLESYKKNAEVGRKIQILTNLPQNTFYVAAVVAVRGADKEDFARAYKHAVGMPRDALLDTFQEEAAKEFRQAFLSAQRDAMKYSKEFSDDDRKSFDAGN